MRFLMKKIQNLVLSFAILVAFLTAKSPSYAVSTVDEVSCVNPTGTIKVNYESGTHGIVGSLDLYSGKDTVYSIKEDQLMQCFCEENGTGIQTNWKRVASLDSDEAKILKSEGYISVPSGSAWGLEDKPYVAKNIGYTCKSSSTNGTSFVESSKGSAPSLAATGNIITIISFFVVGILFTSLGFTLRKRSN